jgi:hypothetical protein
LIFRHGFDAKVTDKGLISMQKLRFENPRVGGSIPPPGTTCKSKNVQAEVKSIDLSMFNSDIMSNEV